MSDFYLDLRPRDLRQTGLAADRLKHFKDVSVSVVEEQAFSLVIAREDKREVWAPFRADTVSVFLAGRIALDAAEWADARKVAGEGGLACKAIFQKYDRGGAKALETLNGNFTAIIYDARDATKKRVFVVTDRAGFAPAFRSVDLKATPVFSSNPDLLAAAIGASDDLDVTSIGEFLAKAHVSFPFTYYKKVRGLEFGAITLLELGDEGVRVANVKTYYEFKYTGSDDPREQSILGSDFAQAFRNAVTRRTQPEMGKSFVAVSGGLDSRTVLSACPRGTPSFSFFDEENFESGIALQIAKTLGSPNHRLKREFDHYANTAPAGVRMEGGMGMFLANLYLGFREQLKELGMDNFLSGCYCDYMFKGLLLNKRIGKISRREELISYRSNWYMPHLVLNSPEMPAVQERIDAIVPPALRDKKDNASVFQVEARRVLPLAYEPDLRGTVHRAMRWSAITADNEMLDMFRRIPWGLKLNNQIFHAMMREVCPPEVLSIWDSNIGAPVNAGEVGKFVGKWRRVVSYQMEKRKKKGLATSGSAPNWDYYFTHSDKMKELWTRENALAREVLTRVVGFNPFEKPLEWWVQQPIAWIIRLFTLKLWFDVRIRAAGDPGAQMVT